MQKGYKKLKVYEEGHKLVIGVYKITATFPREELFGLVSQMRRCSVSVVANILEGHTRATKKDFKHFLVIANGSLVELEYYLELALELRYISKNDYEKLEQQRRGTGLLLGGFINHLKSFN